MRDYVIPALDAGRRAPGGLVHRKLLYTVEEAAEFLSLSRSAVYRLIDLRELGTVKIGKARRVTYAQLDAFVRKEEQGAGNALSRASA